MGGLCFSGEGSGRLPVGLGRLLAGGRRTGLPGNRLLLFSVSKLGIAFLGGSPRDLGGIVSGDGARDERGQGLALGEFANMSSMALTQRLYSRWCRLYSLVIFQRSSGSFSAFLKRFFCSFFEI